MASSLTKECFFLDIDTTKKYKLKGSKLRHFPVLQQTIATPNTYFFIEENIWFRRMTATCIYNKDHLIQHQSGVNHSTTVSSKSDYPSVFLVSGIQKGNGTI